MEGNIYIYIYIFFLLPFQMKGVEGDAYNLREATIPFHILLPFPIERGGGGGGGRRGEWG